MMRPRCCPSRSVSSHLTSSPPRTASTQHQRALPPTCCSSSDASPIGCPAPAGPPRPQDQPSRRSLLLLAASLSLATSLGASSSSTARAAAADASAQPSSVPAASEPPEPDTSTQFVYDFASDLSPNLRVKEYHTIILNTRRVCWQTIAQCIQNKEYAKLALQPTQPPFSDLRAAALYCAWALLQADDYAAASDCRKAYLDFDVHVQDLQQISEAADLDGANPEQVQQSFILLNASLEKFLSTIPASRL